MRSRYARGAVEVRSWCGRGTLGVRSWCGRGTLVVRSRYARGAVERSRYARGTVLVRSRYARGALPVRCVSLTFQQAILYMHIYALVQFILFSLCHCIISTLAISTTVSSPHLLFLHPLEHTVSSPHLRFLHTLTI